MSLGKYANNTKSRKIISLAISNLLILSIMTNIAYVANNGNIALAQPLSTPILPPMSSTTNNNNEGTIHKMTTTQNARTTATNINITTKNP